MLKIISQAIVLLMLSFFSVYSGDVEYITMSDDERVQTPFDADTMFIGAEIYTESSDEPVYVKWKSSAYTNATGKLFFMVPGSEDSSVFLFHNIHSRFPDEDTVINLGTYQEGTPLVFKYVVTDSLSGWEDYTGKNIYSGFNIEGESAYLSERVSKWHGRCFMAAGIDGQGNVEMGIEDRNNMMFISLLFKVTNAVFEKKPGE